MTPSVPTPSPSSPTPAAAAPTPAPATAAIPWKTVTGIRPGDRPLVVWLADPSAHAAIEHRAFDDAAVRLAARAFRTVRLAPEAAKSEPLLDAYAASAPVMLIFSADLTRATATYESSLDAAGVLQAMRVASRTHLGLDLDAAVSRARVLLDEERLNELLRTALVRADPSDVVRAAALDRRRTAIRAEVDGLFRARRAG